MNIPEINVQFLTDEQGNPKSIESNGLKHFKIEVSLKNVPDDVYAANYQLDPSYINPFREEMNKEEEFKFGTTTFGDYSISASLLGRTHNYLTSGIISKALIKQYSGDENPQIKAAIQEISKR